MDDADATDVPARRPRLPDVALPPAGGGAAVPLRMPRTATALALLAGAPDPAQRAWAARLADAAPTFVASDGRVLAIVPDAAAAAGLPDALPALVDDRGRVAAAAGVAALALVVTDQWGEVWHAASIAPGGPWPDPAEVDRWLGYLAIRCAG